MNSKLFEEWVRDMNTKSKAKERQVTLIIYLSMTCIDNILESCAQSILE